METARARTSLDGLGHDIPNEMQNSALVSGPNIKK